MDALLLEYLILGAIQGVTEWLPVSSEGFIVLAKAGLFGGGSVSDLVRQALFLHLGTFLAALVYLRGDVIRLFRSLLSSGSAPDEDRVTIRFLVVATLVSGAIGFSLLQGISGLESLGAFSGRAVMVLIGALLLVTAGLQLSAGKAGNKGPGDLKAGEGIIQGVAQGLAILPGVSRSGTTVAAFLLRGFDKTHALRLSFLMSLPAVLLGNIALNMEGFAVGVPELAGLGASFLLGFATIHTLIKVSGRMNFGYFVLVFGVLAVISGLLL